jgi:hypothetical protein
MCNGVMYSYFTCIERSKLPFLRYLLTHVNINVILYINNINILSSYCKRRRKKKSKFYFVLRVMMHLRNEGLIYAVVNLISYVET